MTFLGVTEPEEEAPVELVRPGAGVWKTVAGLVRGRYPARYGTQPWTGFADRARREFAPGMRILDVGAGASPTIPPQYRPAGCCYVGQDISARELERAPAGSYDATVVAAAERELAELRGQFDLALSWFALEHVADLDSALTAISAHLKPTGALIAQMSGGQSLFALINRALPSGAAQWLLRRTQGRAVESVFPARYDHCWFSALDRLLRARWQRHEIECLYTGAFYFRFSPALRAVYLAYEELAFRRQWRNLAPYYLIAARKGPREPVMASTRAPVSGRAR